MSVCRVAMLAISVFCLSTCSVRAGDDNASLREEVQAMRQAYESRISALESEIKQMKGGVVAKQKSADKQIDEALERGGVAGPAGTHTDTLLDSKAVQGSTQITLGGYTEFTYVDRGDRIGEFNQLRTVAQLGAKIHDRIKLYIELELENGAVIADGEETGGELELEQAYIDYEINKALTFRAGMLLVPVGRYNLYHEGHINNLVDRPLVERRIIPTTWFEEGAGFHGTPLDTDYLGISYEAYALNSAAADGLDSLQGFRDIHREGTSPTNDKRAGAARVAFEPARGFKKFADYLEVGVSGYISGFKGFKGENEDGDTLDLHDGNIQIIALDATYEKWMFGARGEVAFAHADSGANDTQRKQDAYGYYVEGWVKFWPHFLDCTPFGKGKGFKDPKLVFATRYEQVDTNRDRLSEGDISRVTFGIGYRPVPNTVFKLDYQIDATASGRVDTAIEESGNGKRTDAVLFSVSTGF